MKLSLFILLILISAVNILRAQCSGAMLVNPQISNRVEFQIEGDVFRIDSVQWNFGDGSFLSSYSPFPNPLFPTPNSSQIEHYYPTAGTYTVIATVYGTGSCQFNLTRIITSHDSIPTFPPIVDQESCPLQATLDSVHLGANSYYFIGGASDPSVAPSQYKIYRIEDSTRMLYIYGAQGGDIVSDTTYNHASFTINTSVPGFSNPGLYKAEYFVRKYSGTGICYDSTSLYFEIKFAANCHAGFTMFEDSTNSGSWFAYNTSTGDNLTYQWTFGDGASSTQQYPFHTYAVPGHYDICLRIIGDSCVSDFCDTSSVHRIASGNMSSFNVLAPVGIKENKETVSSINLFPSPLAEELFVQFNSTRSEELNFTITEVLGKIVSKETRKSLKGGNEFKFDTSHLTNGFYLFAITDSEEKRIYSKKLIK